MRVAVLKEDNCQPKKCNDECFHYCPPVRNGQECIIMDDKSGKPQSLNHSVLDVESVLTNAHMMH